jgi:SAM-dependent methyltransferase
VNALTTEAAVTGLVCIRCERAALEVRREGWICAACGAGYPIIGDMPWLFRDPQDALAGWRTRLDLLRGQLRERAQALTDEAAGVAGNTLTQRRLAHWAASCEDQARRLEELLAPLALGGQPARRETLQALGVQLPLDQGLANYYVNIHRDWCWGDEENEAAFAEIRAVAGTELALGQALVVGAGAGRLAFDLHERAAQSTMVVSDFNPLLLFVARELFAGRQLELYEFPIAPRRLEDCAVLRTLRAPAPVKPPPRLILADALDAPFARGHFDTVVTPWFIDIVGEPFSSVAARVNAWLKPGGRWINMGSLAFNLAGYAERMSADEVLAGLATAGFDNVNMREACVPYMRSPASRHARLETIVTWCANKHAEKTAPTARGMPEWLIDTRLPVPRTPALEFEQVSSRIHAFLLALVNGERSVADMARMVVEQKLLSAADAESAVKQFLRRTGERASQRTDF